ncbi:hypothetical protein AAFF_G00093490 [Aldrovandia affinis]|uniref:Uncharacterized protein n=1 Tax=Aldrovandia affinis TaxID=143900 RepID=A0AAD7WY83_9TELE|nr:hypothetical protein AAFF_G00093490 [Aldrovandia affinis]
MHNALAAITLVSAHGEDLSLRSRPTSGYQHGRFICPGPERPSEQTSPAVSPEYRALLWDPVTWATCFSSSEQQ